jgi:hypothetical protein
MHIMASRYLLVALVVMVGYSACAQQVQLPDAPSHHKFLDRQNTMALTTLAGHIAVDAVTTQHLTQSGRAHEANPVWRPLVRQGWQGEMTASALGFGAALGVAYTFHKTGHHNLERWANWFTVGTEAAVDCHNLILAARR